MEPRISGRVTAAVVIGVLVAWTWIHNLQSERSDLREALAIASEDASVSSRRVGELEERLDRAERREPKVYNRAYKKGRSDGIAYTCNNLFGDGPSLDAWTHYVSDDYGRLVGEIRAVVIVTFEDGSTLRITRSHCRRWA